MLERADLLGAELQIEDRPGGGTRVRLELTLFADEQGG
jgi:nitrate/nitrite-specific signal transduction histidine kinase